MMSRLYEPDGSVFSFVYLDNTACSSVYHASTRDTMRNGEGNNHVMLDLSYRCHVKILHWGLDHEMRYVIRLFGGIERSESDRSRTIL